MGNLILLTLRLYVIKEVLAPTLMSMLFFTAVLLLVRLLDFADLILKAGIDLGLFLQLLAIITLTLLVLTIPMAVLLGAIIGVGRLANENELLAIRVGGIDLTKVFIPVFILGFILSFFLMASNQYMIPAIYKKIDSVIYMVKIDILKNLRPGVVYDELGPGDMDVSLYFEQVLETEDSDAPRNIRGVNLRVAAESSEFIAGGSQDDEVIMIFAESGEIAGNVESASIDLKLSNGIWYKPEEAISERTMIMQFDSMDTTLSGDESDAAETAEISPREEAFPALYRRLSNPPDVEKIREDEDGRRIPRVWRNYYSARNEMVQRFTLPLSTLAFLLIAVPLAIEIRPRAKTVSVLIAVALMGLYYALLVLAQGIGSAGASWLVTILMFLLPNLLLIISGFFMMRRVSSH